MNEDELKQALAYVAKSQNRRLDETDTEIWDDAIGDLPFDLTMAALRTLVRESERYITPATVRAAVRVEASARLTAAGPEPEPPSMLTAEEYLAWRRTWRTQVMNGVEPAQAAQAAIAASHRVVGLEPAATQPSPRTAVLRQGTIQGEVVP